MPVVNGKHYPSKIISCRAFGMPATAELYEDHLYVRTHSQKVGDRNIEYKVPLSVLTLEERAQLDQAPTLRR